MQLDLLLERSPFTIAESPANGRGAIQRCKERGVFVVLSIDGSKKSGNTICDVPIPWGLYEREISVNVGRSMLKRFQMEGKSLAGEAVSDRLLLTY